MRSLFPGYFRPTDREFGELWKNCTFAFDASVLLGLYRSTTETQDVFFDVLRQLAGRLFLPYHAAEEYLRNRLTVISLRGDIYEDIKREAEKLAKTLQTAIGDHALPGKQEILEAANDNAQRIKKLIETAVKKDGPDFSHSDPSRDNLVELFEGNVGAPYTKPRLEEIYKDGSNRFARKIPPGYKDERKDEPERYGDLVIWFEMMDHAKSSKKPLIFLTADAKEDWWAEHKGATIGPRAELGQEMLTHAGVRFYMYTLPQFLKFAQKYLELNAEATKKAASEFEQIEKQDKNAAKSRDSILRNSLVFGDLLATLPKDWQKTWLNTNAAILANTPSLVASQLAESLAGLRFDSPALNLYKGTILSDIAKANAQAADFWRLTSFPRIEVVPSPSLDATAEPKPVQPAATEEAPAGDKSGSHD